MTPAMDPCHWLPFQTTQQQSQQQAEKMIMQQEATVVVSVGGACLRVMCNARTRNFAER
jgi:hypothetical protein